MKRQPDESFEDYKKRREEEQAETRLKLKGRILWDSAKLGTHRKKTNEAR